MSNCISSSTLTWQPQYCIISIWNHLTADSSPNPVMNSTKGRRDSLSKDRMKQITWLIKSPKAITLMRRKRTRMNLTTERTWAGRAASTATSKLSSSWTRMHSSIRISHWTLPNKLNNPRALSAQVGHRLRESRRCSKWWEWEEWLAREAAKIYRANLIVISLIGRK